MCIIIDSYILPMQSQNKIESFFSQHPQLDTPLAQNQTNIAGCVRQMLRGKSLGFFYQELDIVEENFFDQKMQEVFESYSLSRDPPFTMKKFMLFFVKQDKKIKVKYADYDRVNQKAKEYLDEVGNKKVKEIAEEQQRSRTDRSKKSLKASLSELDLESIDDPSVWIQETSQKPETRLSSPPSSSAFKKSLFSPDRPLDNMLVIKKRLKNLFDIYNRKHYTNKTSLTFDEIPTQVSTFNLNVWMLFNRDFGLLSKLKKNDFLAIFKKYSERQLMGFELFQVAMFDVFKKVYPNDRNQGWKDLSIHSQENYHAKLKELGVPYIDQTQLVIPQYDSPGPRKVLGDRSDSINSNIKSIVKTPSTIKKKVDPFAKIHLQNPIKVENDQQDKVFMKQYKLNNRNNKYVANLQHKKIIQQSPSTGLLKRLDQRIKKYANL